MMLLLLVEDVATDSLITVCTVERTPTGRQLFSFYHTDRCYGCYK